MTRAIGISERASPGPVATSPRLKLAHSEASLPAAWRKKTTGSSRVNRFIEANRENLRPHGEKIAQLVREIVEGEPATAFVKANEIFAALALLPDSSAVIDR
jgi:hypothetical protein